ncbi:MAG: hypothetical protein ACXVPN_10440 [Bacteroidia bacterium]
MKMKLFTVKIFKISEVRHIQVLTFWITLAVTIIGTPFLLAKL